MDTTFRYKQRFDSIIEDLNCNLWGQGHDAICPDSFSVPNPLQECRERLLEDLFDPKIDKIYEESKELVGTLEDISIRTALQSFLNMYHEFRKKEEGSFSHDREAILLDLKDELEKMSENEVNAKENIESEFSAIRCAVEGEESKDTFDVSIKAGNEALRIEGITTTLNSLERLKTTHAQIYKAKAQMEGFCTFLEFRRINKETEPSKYLIGLFSLSERLSNMKKSLESARSNCKRKNERRKIMKEVRTGMPEVMATHKSWKMYETILSNSVEQRKNALKDLKSSLENHKGKYLNDELRKREVDMKLYILSLSQCYLTGIQTTKSELTKVESLMFESANRHQTSLNKNLESYNKACGVFESLWGSSQRAHDCWSKKRPRIMTQFEESSKVNEKEIELRLLETMGRIKFEKSTLTNDGICLRSIAQKDSLPIKEVKPRRSRKGGSTINQSRERKFDLLTETEEIGILVDGFVTATKTAFMTLNALKKIDACLAFISSKLEILQFDIDHQITYLEARNNGVRNINSKNSSTGNQTLGLGWTSDQFIKEDSATAKSYKAAARPNNNDVKSKLVSLPQLTRRSCVLASGIESRLNSLSDKSSLYTKLKGPIALDSTSLKLDDQEDVAIDKLEGNRDLCDRPTLAENCDRIINYGDIKPISKMDHELCVPRKEEIIGQSAMDMARYFRLREQVSHTRRSSPIKFLFYTQGVGVFADNNGELVDALGLPFPKQRQSLQNMLQLPSITIKSTRSCDNNNTNNEFK